MLNWSLKDLEFVLAEERNQGNEDQFATDEEVLELRKATARLIAPFMFQGIEVARRYAEEAGIRGPAGRYDLLQEVSVGILRWPQSRQAYLARYPDFVPYFRGPKHYERIYNNYFSGLIIPAIQEASMVGRGAGRFLEEQGRGSAAYEMIPRSTGLLAISRVSKDGALQLDDRLGNPIEPQHFCLGFKDSREVVNFTQEAEAIIAEYPSPYGGCPTYIVEDPRPGGTAPNLLMAYWEEVSAYAFWGAENAQLRP